MWRDLAAVECFATVLFTSIKNERLYILFLLDQVRWLNMLFASKDFLINRSGAQYKGEKIARGFDFEWGFYVILLNTWSKIDFKLFYNKWIIRMCKVLCFLLYPLFISQNVFSPLQSLNKTPISVQESKPAAGHAYVFCDVQDITENLLWHIDGFCNHLCSCLLGWQHREEEEMTL